MDWYWFIFCCIPAGIVYSALLLYIIGEIITPCKRLGYKRKRLVEFKKRLRHIKEDDDRFCIKEKILLAISDFQQYNLGYGRSYYEKAEDELWEFLLEYIDKDRLMIEAL